MSKNHTKNLVFVNEVINKKKLQELMSLAFHNYGVIKSSLIADKVKNVTFHYATLSGISLSVEDLRVPVTKRSLIGMTTNVVDLTEQNYNSGNITTVERFQKVIDIWNNANNVLKDEVLTYFRESDPLNPLYIMAFSGARGNISQVRQLVGMRGLMADPQGEIIDLPIKSNFREGLKVTEYIISSYGARKGLVDTALRTADSGYLTRRLVDVAQDIIVREEDCLTSEGLSFDDLFSHYKTDSTFSDRLIGRLLAQPIVDTVKGINFPSNTELNTQVVKELITANVKNLTVRSPLTCNALRSVCRKCYGWHLSYSKIIDLGEAVGILAAQSIGEPGTQLTMRTFHTGGVFSGDLTKQIRAPFAGTVKYDLTTPVTLVRTIHGEKGFQLREGVRLALETQAGTLCSLDIPRDALLLVNNEQQIYCNQVIAEIKKDANLILEEDRKNIYTEVSGETFLQNLNIEEDIDGDGAKKRISKTTGLIWVLYGNRYALQGKTQLNVKIGEQFTANQTIACQVIRNTYPGIFRLDGNGEGKIITSSMTFENSQIVENNDSKRNQLHLITPTTKKIFQLFAKRDTVLKHGQTLAKLVDDSYQTKTGGIIYYSTNPICTKKKKSQNRIFTGSLYWVPEETYPLKEEYLNIQEGSFVTKGTMISPLVTATVSGFLEVDAAESEVKIKPGELYRLTAAQITSLEEETRFLQPGELIFPEFDATLRTQKLSYMEVVTFGQVSYVLVRPVLKFKVPQEKGFNIKHRFFPDDHSRGIALRTVKRIFYKDGEKIKSNGKGVDLLQTFLVLDIKNQYSSLNVQKTSTNVEFLILKETDIKTVLYNHREQVPFVKVGDLVRVGTFLTEQTRSKYAGQIYRIHDDRIEIRLGRPYLVSPGTVLRVDSKSLVEKSDMLATLVYDKLKTVDIVQGLPKVEEILEARKIKNGCVLAPHEGKAFFKDGNIEIIKPSGEQVIVPVELNTKVNFTNGSVVNFLDQLTDGAISPHEKLDILFNYYQEKYPIHIACKKSFKRLQLFLVNEVQRTYSSQGVQIADKHIEIIVKQMTSKVRVYFGGDTTLLPGEMLDIHQAEIIVTTALRANEEPPLYRPLLLGLTKASLNSDSFISAASFQETTRVLTEAAIEGKKDWLNGLKENVIIGRLIPAGTGFNSFENLKKVGKEPSATVLIKQSMTNKIKSSVLDERLA
jgi:DNA-directed RNA polymerase subunit beta'